MAINRQQLLERRGDLSQFLFHLCRDGNLKRPKDLYSLTKDDWVPVRAKQCLHSIISNRRIEARSAFGYFNFKVRHTRADGRVLNPNSAIQRDWLKASCFTETPLDHVSLQTEEIFGRHLWFQPYGLAFHEATIRRSNGNPVLYVQTTNDSARYALDSMAESPKAIDFKGLMPLVEGFGPPWFRHQEGPEEIDFRWEREWRINGDLSFSLSDVAFGLCPESEIGQFESLVGGAFPFVDPRGDMGKVKDKLRATGQLKDLK